METAREREARTGSSNKAVHRANAPLSNAVVPLPLEAGPCQPSTAVYVTVSSAVHLSKAEAHMQPTVAGIVMCTKLQQPSKALGPIDAAPTGISTACGDSGSGGSGRRWVSVSRRVGVGHTHTDKTHSYRHINIYAYIYTHLQLATHKE